MERIRADTALSQPHNCVPAGLVVAISTEFNLSKAELSRALSGTHGMPTAVMIGHGDEGPNGNTDLALI